MTRVASKEEIDRIVAAVPAWYHRFELAPGVFTPGVNDSHQALSLLRLPRDCSGMRVLDLGTRDGFFAFEMEKRGADVLAVDYLPKTQTGFGVLQEFFGSRVEFLQANMMTLSPAKIGQFDVILFLGLLYHLRNPLQAIDLVRDLCRDQLFLETWVIDKAFSLEPPYRSLAQVAPELVDVPIMRFYPKNSLNNDSTNYWGPNMKCVEVMLEEARFTVERSSLEGTRGIFHARVRSDVGLEWHRQIATGDVLPG